MLQEPQGNRDIPGPSHKPPMGLPDDTQTVSSQSSQSSNEQEIDRNGRPAAEEEVS